MARKLTYDVTEIKLRVPKHIADKLTTMADSYGVSRQAMIQMIIGQHLAGAEKVAKNITEAIANVIKETQEKEGGLKPDEGKAIAFLKSFIEV